MMGSGVQTILWAESLDTLSFKTSSLSLKLKGSELEIP